MESPFDFEEIKVMKSNEKATAPKFGAVLCCLGTDVLFG